MSVYMELRCETAGCKQTVSKIAYGPTTISIAMVSILNIARERGWVRPRGYTWRCPACADKRNVVQLPATSKRK